MRQPLFLAALALLAFAFLLEIGAGFALTVQEPDPAVLDRYLREETDFDDDEREDAVVEALAVAADRPPGFAVRSLALVDAPLLLAMALLALALVVPHRTHGRLAGVLNLIVGIVIVLLGILLVIVALVALLFMLGLFLSPPFGTLAYLALFGFFDRAGAALILGLALLAKLGFLVLALLAYPRFLREKGLMLLTATSFLLVLLVAFLHGLVPLVLVSIVDAVAAIVVGIVAIVWAIVLIVGSLTSVVRVLRVKRA